MKNLTCWGKNNRNILHTVLPLSTPFSLVIGASSMCNFKCKYCIHSLSNSELKNINYKLKNMDYKIFTKVIDDVKKFPDKIKTIQFMKDGEPLINKHLPEMIKYAKDSNKFEKLEVITNGSILTPELNIKLIDSGLDTLRISIQGISEEKYYKNAGVRINFEKFIDTIKHFYTNKGTCKLHIKIIDIGINNENETKIFYDTFDCISDELSIQYTIPYYNTHINYDEIQKGRLTTNLFGDKSGIVYVCPRPFISLSVSADGNVMPCCRENMTPLILGNVKNDSIYDIWNGKLLKNIRVMHLKKKRFEHINCKDCCLPDKITYDNDNIDMFSNKLLKVYSK